MKRTLKESTIQLLNNNYHLNFYPKGEHIEWDDSYQIIGTHVSDVDNYHWARSWDKVRWEIICGGNIVSKISAEPNEVAKELQKLDHLSGLKIQIQ